MTIRKEILSLRDILDDSKTVPSSISDDFINKVETDALSPLSAEEALFILKLIKEIKKKSEIFWWVKDLIITSPTWPMGEILLMGISGDHPAWDDIYDLAYEDNAKFDNSNAFPKTISPHENIEEFLARTHKNLTIEEIEFLFYLLQLLDKQNNKIRLQILDLILNNFASYLELLEKAKHFDYSRYEELFEEVNNLRING